MNNNKNSGKNNKKKKSFFSLLFGNLFGGKQELGLLEEEQVQSPFRTMVRTFKSNKVAMTALVTFLLIFITVIIGPVLMPINLSFVETSQENRAPGFDLLKVPDSLQGNVEDMAIGSTFTLASATNGNLYIWGKTRVSSTINVRNVPANMGKIKKVAAGFDHAVALNEDGEIFAWGNNRQQQSPAPDNIKKLDNIVDIVAGYQSTVVLDADGNSYMFGNTRNNDYNEYHPYQGQLAKIAVSSDAVLGLTKDGQAVYLGAQQNSYSRVPENMGRIVDISATATTMAAVNEDGKVFIWGNITSSKENNIPETNEKIIAIEGGRFHYTAQTDQGTVLGWGGDYYKQANVPKKILNEDIEKVYTGFYQNYGITKDGKVVPWGLKGYLLGTDELGRDIFTRLLNGGRMSITIGAVAVIIATIIGVTVGGISGYFGGRIDIVLQRLSEMVASLPFLPFAMILSALIGNSISSTQKTYFIMVILGLLSWTSLQRLVRAQVLSVREQEYVIAARAVGVKRMNIVFRHILPNVISVIIVSATLSFASSMLTEATLSFLNFGVQAPQPTWGNMLYGSKNSIVIQNYWWRWVFASIILGICVICINLIGDGLRDAIDPKSQER